MNSSSNNRLIRIFLLVALVVITTHSHGQQPGSGDDWIDALVRWDTHCSEKGCIMFTDMLRGDSGDPADPKDRTQYVTIAVAVDRATAKPAYFAIHLPPNAQQDQGVFIGFTKTTKDGDHWKAALDKEGASRIPFASCDKESCVARVTSGLVSEGRDSHNMDLLEKFLDSDAVLFLYMSQGKPYRTMIPLASFKKEYPKMLKSDLAVPAK